MYAQITFNSGAQVLAQVDSFEIKEGIAGIVPRSASWRTPEGAERRLTYCDPGQVAAVVLLEDDDALVSDSLTAKGLRP